jgi:hypothetical protein
VNAEGGFSIGLIDRLIFTRFLNPFPLLISFSSPALSVDEDEVEMPPTIQSILEGQSQR